MRDDEPVRQKSGHWLGHAVGVVIILGFALGVAYLFFGFNPLDVVK